MKFGLAVIGTLFLILGSLFLLGYPIVFGVFKQFAEQYLSNDHNITTTGEESIQKFILLSGVSSLVGAALCYAWSEPKYRFALKQAVLKDPVCKWNPTILTPSHVLILSSALGSAVSLLYLVLVEGLSFYSIRQEDGIIENMIVINLLISAAIMTAVTISRWAVNKRAISLVYLFFGLAFFFIGMEEISWGQRIIGWETPPALSELNVQDETNIHNLLSHSARETMTQVLGVSFFLVLVVGWFIAGRFWPKIYHYILPHRSLIGLAILIFFAVYWNIEELMEILVSFFIVFYTVRVWIHL